MLFRSLFEIEEDESVIEVFTHLKALYEEQWGDAEATAPPEFPGEIAIEEENEPKSKSSARKESPAEEVIEA